MCHPVLLLESCLLTSLHPQIFNPTLLWADTLAAPFPGHPSANIWGLFFLFYPETEEEGSSETLILLHQTIRRHIPQDGTLYIHRCLALKSDIRKILAHVPLLTMCYSVKLR
jgi:hypothetical protein